MHDLCEVAEWFLRKEPMTHKKLQKLCYYAQAWSCVIQAVIRTIPEESRLRQRIWRNTIAVFI